MVQNWYSSRYKLFDNIFYLNVVFMLLFDKYVQKQGNKMDGLSAAVVQGPINDIYSTLKRKRNMKSKPAHAALFAKGLEVEQVKTIWHMDKPVNIREFYYPSKVKLGSDRIQIDSLSDLPGSAKVVIEGTAGQGKSIFLRYLAGNELRKGQSIPIFIELMRLANDNSLKTLIAQYLTELGFKCNASDVDDFLSTERFVLLLDAFDEVHEEEVNRALNEISSIISSVRNIQVVVTARPDSEIQKHPGFNVHQLAKLKFDDFEPILRKFYGKADVDIHRILSFLKEEKNRVAELVDTPLLLTLVCLTYNTRNTIPKSPHEFYDRLFFMLSERHDSTKPGFRREFKSKLNVNDLERLFKAFSFHCMVGQNKSLSQNKAITEVKKASRVTSINPSSENSFIEDCTRNTCLLVRDGFDIHFIHKSVMEYHAACFIAESSDELKEKFYSAAAEKPQIYLQELNYLEYIDEHAHDVFFLKPMLMKVVDYLKQCLDEKDFSGLGSLERVTVLTKGKLRLSGFLIAGISNSNLNTIFDLTRPIGQSLEQYVDSSLFIADGEVKSKDTDVVITQSKLGDELADLVGTDIWKNMVDVEIQLNRSELWNELFESNVKLQYEALSSRLSEVSQRVKVKQESLDNITF